MKNIVSVSTLTFFIAIAVLFSCDKDNGSKIIGPEESVFTLSGKVVNFYGTGVFDVIIHLAGAEVDETTRTDFLGNYTFTGLPEGGYSVAPSKDKLLFGPRLREVTINGSDKNADEFIGYETSENYFYITGKVAEPNNMSIEGVTINILYTSAFSGEDTLSTVETNSKGYFNYFTKDKSLSLIPVKEGNEYTFSPDTSYVTINENITVVNFTADYSGQPRSTISGRIIDTEGNGIPGLYVAAGLNGDQEIMKTDNSGYYLFYVVKDSTYTVRVSDPPFVSPRETVVVSGDDITVPDIISTYYGPTFFVVSGKVLDSDGYGIPGVTVDVYLGYLLKGKTETDSEGIYTTADFDELLRSHNSWVSLKYDIKLFREGYSFMPDTTTVTLDWKRNLQLEEISIHDITGIDYVPLTMEYFPLKTGASWTYARTVDDETPSDYTVSIPGSITENGITYSQMTPLYLDCFCIYRIESSVVYTLLNGEDMKLLEFGAALGTEWELDLIDDLYRRTCTFLGTETVEVPAGTFTDCALFDIRIKYGQTTYDSTKMWFARNAGLVKSVKTIVSYNTTIETINNELKEFDIEPD